jgi:hypothetical protein
MAHVGLEWSHGMHMTTLDTQTWPRGNDSSLGLTDKDVGLPRGVDCDILAQCLIEQIEYSYKKVHLLFQKSISKELWVKCAWPRAILGWVTVREVFSGAHE